MKWCHQILDLIGVHAYQFFCLILNDIFILFINRLSNLWERCVCLCHNSVTVWPMFPETFRNIAFGQSEELWAKPKPVHWLLKISRESIIFCRRICFPLWSTLNLKKLVGRQQVPIIHYVCKLFLRTVKRLDLTKITILLRLTSSFRYIGLAPLTPAPVPSSIIHNGFLQKKSQDLFQRVCFCFWQKQVLLTWP